MHRKVVATFLAVIFVLCNSASAFPRSESRKASRRFDTEEETGRDSESSSWLPSMGSAEYRVLNRVLDDCIKSGDGVNCLKGRAVTFLDRVSKLKSMPLFDGVALKRLDNVNSESPLLNEAELEASLPRDLSQKSDRLDQMLYDRLINFWNGHTLSFDFASQDVVEGRSRKQKKLLLHLLMGLALSVATVGPIAFKGLAALALKALIAAKVALVLASIIAFKTLGHHGGDSHRSYAFEETEHGGDHWMAERYGRSYSESTTEQAHKMAYSAQLQRPITVA